MRRSLERTVRIALEVGDDPVAAGEQHVGQLVVAVVAECGCPTCACRAAAAVACGSRPRGSAPPQYPPALLLGARETGCATQLEGAIQLAQHAVIDALPVERGERLGRKVGNVGTAAERRVHLRGAARQHANAVQIVAQQLADDLRNRRVQLAASRIRRASGRERAGPPEGSPTRARRTGRDDRRCSSTRWLRCGPSC